MNIKKVISSIGVGAGAIILGFGLQYTLASWTAAPSNPPTGNVAAPINVSGGGENGTSVYAQVKTGLLTLENLAIVNLNVASGTVTTAGSVLTNDGNGNASWMVANSTGGATSTLVYINPVVIRAGMAPYYGNSCNGDAVTSMISLQQYGIPSTASAVILTAAGFANEDDKGGTSPTLAIVGPNSSSYFLLYQDSGSSNLTSSNEGIYPIISSNGLPNLEYTASSGWNCYGIQLVGYVTGNVNSSSGGGGIPNNIVVFNTSSSTWTVPPGVTKIDVRVWGAGGGGGSASNCSGGGAGGGAGGYGESVLTVTPGTLYTITVGTGGTGGTSGNNNSTAGTATTFGASVRASGGAMGPNDCYATVASTVGGVAVATIAIPGGMGGPGGSYGGSGQGGSSPEGGQGGISRANNGSSGYGDPGVVPGGGGGGGNGVSPGGAGANGMVVIEY